MATKYAAYFDDSTVTNGDTPQWAVAADETLFGLYVDVVSTFSAGLLTPADAPTLYDTLALLIAAVDTVIGIFPGQPRGVTLQALGFGSAFLPILTDKMHGATGAESGGDFRATLKSIALPSATSAPTIAQGDMTLAVTGYKGETINNIPVSA